MDVNRMLTVFQEHGFRVVKYHFHEIANRVDRIRDSIIFYTFSQKSNRRQYIHDIIQLLNSGGNTVIPSLDLLRCHENKGYQEIYKKTINFHSLRAYYFSSLKELPAYDIQFPLVLKKVDTSNGKGVYLVYNKRQLESRIKKLEKQSFFTQIDLVRRKYFRKKKVYEVYPDYNNRRDYYEYRDYILKEHNFVIQEFIPDLTSDFRIVVLFDKYYVMRRFAREGDFRASGTKLQDYDDDFDPNLLSYAKDIFDRFDTPILSMDIGFHQGQHFLFEFQALHFGLNVFFKTKGYFAFEKGAWNFHEETSSIERGIVEAVIKYVKAHFKNY